MPRKRVDLANVGRSHGVTIASLAPIAPARCASVSSQPSYQELQRELDRRGFERELAEAHGRRAEEELRALPTAAGI